MSRLFDDVSRIIASPLSRRKALALVGKATGGAVLAALGLGTVSWSSLSTAYDNKGNDRDDHGDDHNKPKCGPSQTVCGKTCCNSNQTCCDGKCCSAGQTCCGKKCCGAGQKCCDEKCCDPGETCCKNKCCAGPCCGGKCCEKHQVCCDGKCLGQGVSKNGKCRPDDD